MLKVNSTEVQNNFGKYLLLAQEQDVIITRNGTARSYGHLRPKRQARRRWLLQRGAGLSGGNPFW